jgi:hypothetical protein
MLLGSRRLTPRYFCERPFQRQGPRSRLMSKSPSEAPIAWGGSTRTILSMQVRSGLLRHRGVARLENRHRVRHSSADAPSVSSAHDRMPADDRTRAELHGRHDTDHATLAVQDGDGRYRLVVTGQSDLVHDLSPTHRQPPSWYLLRPFEGFGVRPSAVARTFRKNTQAIRSDVDARCRTHG